MSEEIDQRLLSDAQKLFDGTITWADFQNAVFAQHDGLIALAYPDPDERDAFYSSETYARLSELRSRKIRETGVINGASPLFF